MNTGRAQPANSAGMVEARNWQQAMSGGPGRRVTIRWRGFVALAWMAVMACGTVSTPALAAEPVVVVQSLPMGGEWDASGTRVFNGAKAYLARINAEGGLGGRPIELVTLDDAGDPARHAANLRKAIVERRAVAILGCVGENLCTVSAAMAREFRIPLIGPLSGSETFNRSANPYVFRVRATLVQESSALARQLRVLGCSKVALVSDATSTAEQLKALRNALTAAGLAVSDVRLSAAPGGPGLDLDSALKSFAREPADAVLMAVGSESLEEVIRAGVDERSEWPRIVVTTASGNLNTLLGGFKRRVVGFSSVVPNPESGPLLITRELQADAEKYAGGHAITFDGMEGYIAAKVLVRALRGAPATAAPGRLVESLSAMANEDLGGYVVSFTKGRESGSTWVDVGVRARSGLLLR